MTDIFIIEDLEVDFLLISDCLKKYNLVIYPSNLEEFRNFSDLLARYAKNRNMDSYDRIINIIKGNLANTYLIDLSLIDEKGKIPRDETGLVFLKYLNDEISKSIKIIITSTDKISNKIQYDDIISKDATHSLESQIITKVIYKYFKANHIKGGEDNKDLSKYTLPPLLKEFGEYEHFKLMPWVSFVMDKFVIYIFYIILFILFISGPVYILHKIYIGKELIQIAEYSFIAFLPFLVTCGFFIFYNKSLRPYFLAETVNIKEEDFESSSTLMKLTKKLFVSSLLSYLFIKLIEFLCFEEPETDRSIFQRFYGTENQFIQLYFIVGLVIILILYYIYIDKNSGSKRDINL